MKFFECANDWLTGVFSVVLLIGFMIFTLYLMASPILAAMYILHLLGVIG